MYTIKEVAAQAGESEHTIRFYCKEGLFPFLTRDQNNVRKFSAEDLDGVRIVLCLRDMETYRTPLMKELSMNHLPHDTRHTTVSLLVKAEVNQTIIKRIVGAFGSHEPDRKGVYPFRGSTTYRRHQSNLNLYTTCILYVYYNFSSHRIFLDLPPF